jgi:hypothetical protein
MRLLKSKKEKISFFKLFVNFCANFWLQCAKLIDEAVIQQSTKQSAKLQTAMHDIMHGMQPQEITALKGTFLRKRV